MKQHMLPETAQMFAQCVHRVVARKDSYGPDIHRWLAKNIEKMSQDLDLGSDQKKNLNSCTSVML
jgi:hypothetical protein